MVIDQSLRPMMSVTANVTEMGGDIRGRVKEVQVRAFIIQASHGCGYLMPLFIVS